VLEPLNVQIAISTRDTPITPYQTYFPFSARLGGLFNGDSLSEIQRGPHQELILASRGTAWANEVEVRAPNATDPVIRMDSLVIGDVDFSWPNYALVKQVTLAHPQVLLERNVQGQINLRTLFTVPQKTDADHAGTPSTAVETDPASDTKAAREGLLQTMVI